MTVSRGTTTLRKEHFATSQFRGKYQAHSARKVPSITSVCLESRKLAAFSKNLFSDSSCRNLLTLMNTENGVEFIRTGLLTSPEQ